MQQDIVLIYARAANGTIGKDGAMPWHLPEDLKRFKQLTMGKPMIMGRRTYESFGEPLPGRRHIVFTRDKEWTGTKAEVVNTMGQALERAGNGEIAVVGGAQIYGLFLPLANRIELTQIHEDYDGDTHMPAPGEEWVEIGREDHPAKDGKPAYSYISYVRAHPVKHPESQSVTRLDHRSRVPDSLRGAIVAMGNFDGFHLGHQAVVKEAVEWAKAEGRKAIVATFDPHPIRHFAPHVPPFRLTTLDQREELFRAAGADAMMVFHFDQELATTSAEDFISKLLCERIGAAGVVTGEDFTFGKDRGGNRDLLESMGQQHGMQTRAVAPVMEAGMTVSSSRIRDALKAGDCEGAARLLTRPFALRGIVQHGDKRGRTIGFPTANLCMGNYLRPRYGIYAVTVRVMDDGTELKGAANLGVRPTFDPPIELLEPYLFDFSGDLYGRELEVRFHHYLRPEMKFNGVEELVNQMTKDCGRARELLA